MLSFTKLLLFFSKLSKKESPNKQTIKKTQPLERIQNSRTHSRQTQHSVCFGFFSSTCYTRRQIQIRFASVDTAGGNYRLLHEEQRSHLPHNSTPFLSLPRWVLQLSTGTKCFSPLKGKAELCLLDPELHPCGPTGWCARQPFPNPFCCSTGSCQSSLCLQPRLPPSSRVYTLCWICSACHLQRQCLGPAKTPQIQLSPVPPPASALGQGIMCQLSSQGDCSLQIQLSAESHFLRLDMQVMEKAIFCLCQICKYPEAERKAYTLQRLIA